MTYWKSDDGVIIADWDADGAVSAAILLYLQNNQLYPVKKKVDIHTFPSGPREIERLFNKFSGCPAYYAFLDIPFTTELGRVFERIKKECPNTMIVYIDHHFSSLENLGVIRKYVDKLRIGKSKPTSMHLNDIAIDVGKKLPERLRLFAESIGFIELGRRPPEDMLQVVELVASLARALKLERKRDFWTKMVKWMSSPLPIPLSKSDMEILERVKEESQKKDEELEKAATDLAVSALKVGCFRFIDARRKWKRRGVSSLATRLARKLRSPIALLATLGDGEILVIRTRNNAAKLIADEIQQAGYAEDIGGHGNLSIVKLKKEYNFNEIKKILLRSCRFVR